MESRSISNPDLFWWIWYTLNMRYLTGKSSTTWNVLWRYLLGYKQQIRWYLNASLTMRDTRTIAILIGKTWKNNSSLFHVHPFPVKQQSVILEQKLWCYGDLKQRYHQPVLTFSVSNHPQKAAQISPAQAMFGIWKLIRWTKTFDCFPIFLMVYHQYPYYNCDKIL